MQRRSFVGAFFKSGALALLPSVAVARIANSASTVTDPPRPVPRSLLLQTSPVAGFQYHKGESIWPSMSYGDRLALIREPDNPYDAKAVRIDWNGLKLGYVPRVENHAVSQMLDRGELITARIVRLRESSNPWKRVKVAIEVVV